MKNFTLLLISILLLTACGADTRGSYADGYEDGYADGTRIGAIEAFPDAYNKGHDSGFTYCQLQYDLIDPSTL